MLAAGMIAVAVRGCAIVLTVCVCVSQALAIAPDNVMFMFNVAFVQFQIVQFSINLPETLRTLEDLEAASKGLDEAIQ